MAKELHCDACAEHAAPGLRRMLSTVSHVPGRVSEWDGFYWRHPVTGIQSLGLMMVDVGSRSPVAIIQKTAMDRTSHPGNLTAKEAVSTFLLHWAPHRGTPRVVRVDPDGAFRDKVDFENEVQKLGVMIDTISAEAHWQLSVCEGMNRSSRTQQRG